MILLIQDLVINKGVAPMSTGERIKERRKTKYLRQIDLAKRINVSSQVISNWERGYSSLSQDDIKNLADALDCTTDYLLERTDDPHKTINKEKSERDHLIDLINSVAHDDLHFEDFEKWSEESLLMLYNTIKMINKAEGRE